MTTALSPHANDLLSLVECKARFYTLRDRTQGVATALAAVMALDELDVGDESVFAEDNPDHALTRAWAVLRDLKANPLS